MLWKKLGKKKKRKNLFEKNLWVENIRKSYTMNFIFIIWRELSPWKSGFSKKPSRTIIIVLALPIGIIWLRIEVFSVLEQPLLTLTIHNFFNCRNKLRRRIFRFCDAEEIIKKLMVNTLQKKELYLLVWFKYKW